MESDSFSFVTMSKNLKVIFDEIPERFHSNSQIPIKFTFKNYKSHFGDSLAIFKLGWTSLNQFLVKKQITEFRTTDLTYTFDTLFSKDQDENEQFYQFCYISADQEILGVSVPFQITSKPILSQKENQLTLLLQEKDAEIKKLREENSLLTDSLRAMVQTQQILIGSSSKTSEINDLTETAKKFKEIIREQQIEIDKLKLNEKLRETEIVNLKNEVCKLQQEILLLKDNGEKIEKQLEEMKIYKENCVKQLEIERNTKEKLKVENCLLVDKFDTVYKQNTNVNSRPPVYHVDFGDFQALPTFPELLTPK